MAMSAELRSKFAVLNSPVMVASPYEWKILEWDEKSQIDKQIVRLGNTFVKHTMLYMYKLYPKEFLSGTQSHMI